MIMGKKFNTNEKTVRDMLKFGEYPVRKIYLTNGTIFNNGLKEAFREFPKYWIELGNGTFVENKLSKEYQNTRKGKLFKYLLSLKPATELNIKPKDFYNAEDRKNGFEFDIHKKGHPILEEKVLEIDLEKKSLSVSRKFKI
ncbi:MAG: hypothetical protein KC516_02680 [Nanoarchaeota archaeon]|nr:hypothetical protein [Nanoarchaeota archaeon]